LKLLHKNCASIVPKCPKDTSDMPKCPRSEVRKVGTGSTQGTHTVYRSTKFHGTSTAEVTVYRQRHGTILKCDNINEKMFTVKSFLLLCACKDLLLKLSTPHHYRL